MKKTIITAAVLMAASLNAAAYFDGGLNVTSGPDGYRGSKLNVILGAGNISVEPSMASYTSDALDKVYRTYALRGVWETDNCSLAGEAGRTPEVKGYSNKFAGGDITFSLTPGKGGRSRLAGPGMRGETRSGSGVTRIDVGAGLRHISHENTSGVTSLKNDQTQYSLFAGAKILMVNLSASYTGYAYGEEKTVPLINPIPGHLFVYGAAPKSSVNARLDLPGQLMLTPFVGYTRTKYKNGVDDSAAYLFGAYIDLSMVTANLSYQVFDNGPANDSFLSVGAGIKF
jgi:hypothetical protein